MNTADVKEIAQVSAKRANDYLALGWSLLGVFQSTERAPEGFTQGVVYALGWARPEEPSHPADLPPTLSEQRQRARG